MNKDDKYWQKVIEAFKTIEEAQGNEVFQRWLKEGMDELEFDYDQYSSDCYQSIQMPQSFDEWALAVFVGRQGWKDLDE